MTLNDIADHLVEASEERPFQVVLVDIKKAAEQGEIHCIEKPLMGSGDLKYVAISYRWGEVQETIIDTGVGYMATISSFNLESLIGLCKSMVVETDLRGMEYVWVDAICVNQTNYKLRKATIYQMSNIYNRANHIVAVPDLHLAYLENINEMTRQIVHDTMKHSDFIYHLIHGNFADLALCDQRFLDSINVPQDPQLRHLLTKYTDHFMDGFITCRHHDINYHSQDTLDHIYKTNPVCHTPPLKHRPDRKILESGSSTEPVAIDTIGIDKLHICDNLETCPLYLFHCWNLDNWFTDGFCYGPQVRKMKYDLEHSIEKLECDWKPKIPARSKNIRQSMKFLADLIKDWSTRVWVISEYHIAKRKKENKMKFWFIQLGNSQFSTLPFPYGHNSFFEFDFYGDGGGDDLCSGASMSSSSLHTTELINVAKRVSLKPHKNTVYKTFHATLQQQLTQQTFMEMLLKSKAARNDDRLYAILPLTDYKAMLATIISKDQVMTPWRIDTLLSVKLQLYEWASTKHKWELLYLSTKSNTTGKVLPTFASSNICWPKPSDYPHVEIDINDANFFLTDESTIKMTQQGDYPYVYILTIRPDEYYRNRNYFSLVYENECRNPEVDRFLTYRETVVPKDKITLNRLLQLDIHNDALDIICIPNFGGMGTNTKPTLDDPMTQYIFLIGCFEKSKWILKNYENADDFMHLVPSDWDKCYNVGAGAISFNIY